MNFDDAVNQLVNMGFSRQAAEVSVREQLGLKTMIAARGDKDVSILEKEEQAEISKLFRAYGFDVKNLSQARPSKQAPGVPDLIVVHRVLPIWFWWESKRQVGGEYSPAQLAFRDDCRRCKIGWGGGDRHDAANHLVYLGLAVEVDGSIEPAPPSLKNDPSLLQRVAELRRHLLIAGASPGGLRATPSDLERFKLDPWAGLICGIACVDSPVTIVSR